MDITSPLELRQSTQQYELLRAVARYEAAEFEKCAALSKLRPSRFLPVLIYHDGLRWVCSFGNIAGLPPGFAPAAAEESSGVEGYGRSPEEATQNFDKQWVEIPGEDKWPESH